MKEPLQIIADHSREGAALREKFFSESGSMVNKAAFEIAVRIAEGGKLLLCGNGGSAADCQHVAGEFVNRFLVDRPALPAIALTTDTSTITAIGNDNEFADIFSRQVEALGKESDALLAISTSGSSQNVINALFAARERGLFRIGLSGKDGGKMGPFCDISLVVPSAHTPLIQEVHLAVEHLLCQLVDYYLFENLAPLADYLKKNNKD